MTVASSGLDPCKTCYSCIKAKIQLGSSQRNFTTALLLMLLEKVTSNSATWTQNEETHFAFLTVAINRVFRGGKNFLFPILLSFLKLLNTAAFNGLLFTNTYLLLRQNKSSNFCFCLSLRHADKNIFYSSVVKGYSHLTLNTDMLLGSLPGSLCHPGFRSICLSAKSPFWSVIFHFDTRNAFWSNFSSPLNSRHNENGNHIAVAMWRFPQFGVYLLMG